MKTFLTLVVTALFLNLILVVPALADIGSSLTSGTQWLLSQQNPDGSFGADASIIPLQTTEAIYTLKIQLNTDLQVVNAINFLNSYVPFSQDDTARIAAVLGNLASAQSLVLNQNTDAGWGINAGYNSDLLDTALALSALKATGYSDQTVINNALNYLLANQNTDGGFGFYQGDDSNVYMTALTAITLQQFPQTTSLATALNKSKDYLLLHQNTDGGFGSSPSTVYETAYAFMALMGATTDATVLGKASNYLLTTQAADGSWNQDAYSTALALRAVAWAVNPPVPPSSGQAAGQVTDAATNQPLGGVAVVLAADANINTLTDAAGKFTLSNIPAGNQQVNFSLAGYAPAAVSAWVNGNSTVNLGIIALSVNAGTDLSVKGAVTDAATGLPIAGAKVGAYSNTPLQSTQTEAAGNYTLTGITVTEFTLKASAIGYNSQSLSLQTAGPGMYTANFALTPSQGGNLRITELSTDKGSYGLNENVVISATVENVGSTEEQGVVLAEIQDGNGQVLGLVGPSEPHITLSPAGSLQVSMQWNSGQAPPGDYMVVLKIINPTPPVYPNIKAAILTEGETRITFTAVTALDGAIALNPPVTQMNLQAPVAITAAVRNSGNVPINTTLRLEINFKGDVVYSRDIVTNDLPVNNVLSVDLGSYTPQNDGDYAVTLKPANPFITSNITKNLYVGPYASGTFTATPDKLPSGDSRVMGRINLQGVGASTGTVEDPLVPLIKNAIQKAVNWEQPTALQWQQGVNSYGVSCYGCHVQAQTLIGSELSRNKVTVDDTISKQLLDFMKSCQILSPTTSPLYGAEGKYPNNPAQDVPVRATTTYAWSLSYYHDEIQIQDALSKAVNYLISKQNISGFWTSENCYIDSNGYSEWWSDLGCGQPSTPFTAYNIVALVKAYQLTGLQQYKDSMLKAVNYLNGIGYTSSVITAAHIVMGLRTALPLIDDPGLKTVLEGKINSAVAYIRSAQNPSTPQILNGGWPRYKGGTSDSLPTAHALYAMSLAGVSGNDTALRDGITYLLNHQNFNNAPNPDGTWATAFIRHNTLPDKYFMATTWAMISMPVALETVAGVAASLTVTLPSNIILNDSSITPTKVTPAGNDITYLWDFRGLDQSGKELQLDLTVKQLLLGETRAAAQEAYLTFKDDYTGNMINLPLSIPVITGTASVTLGVSTDKPSYRANEEVKIKTVITNNSSQIKNPLIEVFIEDFSGNQVAQVTSFTANNLEPVILPGWAYRMPASLTATKDLNNKIAGINLDFSQVFATLGIPGKTLDQNSIRVIEVDARGNLVGEKQARADFKSTNNATILWLVDGLTANNTTRYFQIFFDSTDNGSKLPSVNTKLPQTTGLIAYTDDAGKIYTMESNWDGTWGAPQYVDDLTSATDLTRGVVLDDFNGDGYVDIITGSGYNGKIYYYQNKADGTNTFNSKKEIGTISGVDRILGLASEDFNNDGKKDFVVSGNTAVLYLFKGNGDGTFIQSTLPVPSGSSFLRGKATADFDGDGQADIVATECCNGAIYLYKGKGNGTFSTPLKIGTTGSDVWGVAAGDYNEDGKIDIIANTGSTGATDLLLGYGNGSFGSPLNVASLNTNAGLATGNFSINGHLDIVATDSANMTISFYPGKGDGTFGPKVTIAITAYTTVGISSSPPLPHVKPALGSPEVVPSQSFNFTWNTGATFPGSYRVRGKLYDAGALLSEATADFTILADKALSSKITAAKISYNANESVTLASQIQSTSANAILSNLTARVTLANAQGAALFTKGKTVPLLTPGQLTELKSYWNTAANPPGIYNVALEVREGSTVLGTSNTSFTILGSSQTGAGLRGTITAQPNPAYQGQEEAITYSLTNNGNEDLASLSGQVIIVDPDTQAVKATLGGQYALAKSGSINDVRTTATVNLTPKIYLVILQGATPAMAAPKTLASCNFTVLPDNTLTSKVTADKTNYSAQETATFTSTIQSTSHFYTFSNLNVKLTLNNAQGQSLFTDNKTVPILAPGQSTELVDVWDTATYPPGTYTAVLEVREGTTVLSTTNINFTILGSSVTGAGLKGTLTAQPNPVYQGKEETFTWSVTNNGNEDLTNLSAKITVLEADTQQVKLEFSSQYSIKKGETITEVRAFSTANLTPKNYLAVLQASTPLMSSPKALASATFEVKPGIDITQTIPDVKHVLVWLNYNWQSGQNCPDRASIEQALQEAGVTYHLVLEKKDFENELRNLLYTDFLILGDHHPMEDHYSEELREQVYSGKGLISSLFNRQNLDQEVFGLKFTGHLSGSNYPVELVRSEIADSGTFPSTGGALRIEALNPAENLGWIVETTKKGTTKYPGIIKRLYGKGKVLFFAFDLGFSTTDYSAFAAMLKNSLNYIHTPVNLTAYYPYQLVPVEIMFKSLGGEFDLKISETYPVELKLYDPLNDAWVTDNPWLHSMTLAPNETKSIFFYVLFPTR